MIRVVVVCIALLLSTGAASSRGVPETCIDGSGAAVTESCTRFLNLRNLGKGERELALTSRAQMLLRIGRHREAIEDYTRLLSTTKPNVYLQAARSEAWFQAGDLDRALADADAALGLDRKNAGAHTVRAQVLESKLRTEEALSEIGTAIRLDPKPFFAYVVRASILDGLGRRDEVVADAKTAVTMKASFGKDYVRFAYEDAALARLDASLSEARHARPVPAIAPRMPIVAVEEPPRPYVPREDDAPPVAPAATPLRGEAGRRAVERRVALVIGNSHYASVPMLSNPEADARGVARALEEAGFATTVRLDLGRVALNESLAVFAGEAASADWAVVYFAGHGIQTGGKNYIIPVDARLSSEQSVRFEALPLDLVTDAVSGARKVSLVVMDACRKDPFVRAMKLTTASRSIGRGLARPDDPNPGMLIAFAARDGEEAADGAVTENGSATKNSPFAAALIREISIPGIELRRTLDRISDDVTEVTGGQQHPLTYGHLSGRADYYFTRPEDTPTDRVASLGPAQRFVSQVAVVQPGPQADQALSSYRERLKSLLDADHVLFMTPSPRNDLLRLRISSASRADAIAICEKVKALGASCFVALNL